ncbi:MAG: BREX-6 system phosphatase PglZ [Phormidesmis sp.]
MPPLGPITSTLEADVSRELRNQKLVIWLDKDSHYTAFVDQLALRHSQGNFFAPVVSFRGSYLETMLALENHGNHETPDLLLIHLPGHIEDTVRKTPLLELYRAGTRYRKALDTLVREAATGKVSPDDIEGYLSHGVLDLAQAEQWLQTALSQPQDNLSHYLDNLDLTWILDSLIEGKETFTAKFDSADTLPLLVNHLNRSTGLDEPFIDFYLQITALKKEGYDFGDLAVTFIAWLMSVEYVHDLTREAKMPELKRLKALSKPLQGRCDRLINHLRSRHPDTYAATATLVEARLIEEFANISPEDLGKIDTFRLEETTVLEKGALQALATSNWPSALHWAKIRLDTQSFWLQRDPQRRLEWLLIQSMAHLGNTIVSIGQPLTPGQTLQAALDTYTQSGYQVDLAHRHLEQQRSKLLESTLPHFTQLSAQADRLRQTYRTWADSWAVAFSHICEAEGFLPEPALQQRTLYEQVVHPLTQASSAGTQGGDAKVAYFLVDAFRYEMATELLLELEGAGAAGTTALLKARYAELPTLTSVGMNALSPVQKGGRLTLAKGEFKGFKSGEYTVSRPADRLRAMCDRSIDGIHRRAKALTLSEVCEKSTKSLKSSLSKIDLVVVHSKEIDDAGEANVGIVTFERWLQQLKSAWNHLRTLGFNEFVFTADHGFLLQDRVTLEERTWGKKADPKRRHVLIDELRTEDDLSTVSLSSLGYSPHSSDAAKYVVFPKNTAIFATGNPGATFVHGGNSLQERVIPVLTVSHRYQSNPNWVPYVIEAEVRSAIAGFERVQVKVKPAANAQGVLTFTGARQINLSLRVPNRPDIDVDIAEAPDAQLKNQQVQIAIDQDWVEILFKLKGPKDERIKLEVYHSDGAEDVQPTLIDTYFDVAGSKQKSGEKAAGKVTQVINSTEPASDWQSSFEDTSIRDVFLHLAQYNAITETELTRLLGSPRKVRQFALHFETHLQKVPFAVSVETTSSGKRYVKGNQGQ